MADAASTIEYDDVSGVRANLNMEVVPDALTAISLNASCASVSREKHSTIIFIIDNTCQKTPLTQSTLVKQSRLPRGRSDTGNEKSHFASE